MEARRDEPDGLVLSRVGQNLKDGRPPVDLEGRAGDGEIIGLVPGGGVQCKFEFHGGLAFKAEALAQAGEGGHGVEEAPGAGGGGAVKAAGQGRAEQRQLLAGEGRNGRAVLPVRRGASP